MILYGASPIKIKKIIDLTHTLHENIPTWSGGCGFHSKIEKYYDPAYTMEYHFPLSSAGTHIDAPAHFIKGAAMANQIPLENLIIPLHLIDVTKECHPDFFLLPKHIEVYEKNHGKILANSFVVAYTGWQKHWDDPKAYRNKSPDGTWHYPGFSLEAAELLIEKDIAGIGIDTLNPDGNDRKYPVHYAILGAGKYIVENLTNLDQLPERGAYVILMPLKIDGAPEVPIRAAAFLA